MGTSKKAEEYANGSWGSQTKDEIPTDSVTMSSTEECHKVGGEHPQ